MKVLQPFLFVLLLGAHSLTHGMAKQKNTGLLSTLLVGIALCTVPAADALNICELTSTSNDYQIPGCRNPKNNNDGTVDICVKHFKHTEQRKPYEIQTTKMLNPFEISMDQRIANAIFEYSPFWKFDDMEPNILNESSYLRNFVRQIAKIINRKSSRGLIISTKSDPAEEREFGIKHDDAFAKGHCADTLYIYDYRITKSNPENK